MYLVLFIGRALFHHFIKISSVCCMFIEELTKGCNCGYRRKATYYNDRLGLAKVMGSGSSCVSESIKGHLPARQQGTKDSVLAASNGGVKDGNGRFDMDR